MQKINFTSVAGANSSAMEAETIQKNGRNLKKLIFFCIVVCVSFGANAQSAAKPVERAVTDSATVLVNRAAETEAKILVGAAKMETAQEAKKAWEYCLSKNYTEAEKLFRQLAEMGMGSELGQYGLGFLYENGFGVPQSNSQAIEWYKKAAAQGYEDAIEKLKKLDPTDAKAQNDLGDKYYNSENYAEAVKWYQKAAEQGDAYAQFKMGYLYYKGFGVTQDYTEAAKWYRKSAEQGYMYAQSTLGVMYEYGLGVEKSVQQAIEWYKKAAAQGYEDAVKNLKELQELQEAQDEAKAALKAAGLWDE